MKIKGDELYMVRSDNETFTVTMEEDGVAVPFGSTDTVTMSVRNAVEYPSQDVGVLVFSTTGVIDTEGGSAIISILPANTKGLYFGWGKYVYDIQADTVSYGRKTVQPESPFVLLREVTTNA